MSHRPRQLGDRPAAHKSSEHDYDGDDMLLTWDPRIVQKVKPMAPLPAQTPAKDSFFLPPNNDDMQTRMLGYFSECILRTTLGKLVITLRTVADREGATSTKATELANLCLLQVDQPDKPIPLPEWCSNYQLQRPHWCNSGNSSHSYRSNKALGQLADRLKEAITATQECKLQPTWGCNLYLHCLDCRLILS